MKVEEGAIPFDRRNNNNAVFFPYGHVKSDVALNLYDFVVRRPGAPAEKYGLRAYDEIILAPMVSHLF